MFISLALLLLVAAVVAAAVVTSRAVARRSGDAPTRASTRPPTLRSLFTYLLLFLVVVVTATGAAGLIGQLLDRLVTGGTFVGDPVEAARNGAFVVVGLPLCGLVGLSVRRSLRADPAQRDSLVWAGYLTAVSLVALVTVMTSAHDSLMWALRVEPENPRAVGRVVIWSLVWFLHWRLATSRDASGTHREPHLLIGSAIGLATTCVAVVGVIGNTVDLALGLQRDTFADPHDQLRRAAATLLVGGSVWALYWWRTAARATRDESPGVPAGVLSGVLGRAYVLLVGTVAGIVTGVVGAAWAVSDVLVWFLGTGTTASAAEHFRGTPHLVATAGVGLLLWWYHTGLLGRPGVPSHARRAEVHRVRDYGAAALGILACCVSGTLVVVALVESLTRSVAISGTPPRDVALTGVAVLIAGLPVWWLAWRSAQRSCRAEPGPERASVTRRSYLLSLTGVGVIVAVGSLLATVYVLFEDLFAGDVGLTTLRSMRYALGILVVSVAVAGAHAALFRTERALHPHMVRRTRFVVLVGNVDATLAHEVAHVTGARVLSWPRTDGVVPNWTATDVTRLVAASPGPDVVVLDGPQGLMAIPVDRSRSDVAAKTVPTPPPPALDPPSSVDAPPSADQAGHGHVRA